MFLARQISKLRKALNEINFKFQGDYLVLKVQDDVCYFKLENEVESYYVLLYEKGNVEDKFSLQIELEKYGIKTGIVLCVDKIVVYKDYSQSDFYRFANNGDLKDEVFVKNLANWYKKLHSLEIDFDDKYKDYFTVSNINLLKRKLNMKNNAFLDYVLIHFDNIKLKFERVKKCIVCGEFFVENVVVSRDNSHLFVIGKDNFHVYHRSEDINCVFNVLDKSYHLLFMDEYGKISEDEIVIGEVVDCIVNLCKALEFEKFPNWANKYLNLINSNDLLNKAKILVDWY